VNCSKLVLAGVCLWSICMPSSCGYHVAGKGALMPEAVHSICIPPFKNTTVRYKLTDRLADAISREFTARTHYRIINDPDQADAILKGTVINYVSYPIVFDQATGRASGLQVNVTMQVSLVERVSGNVIFTRPNFEVHDRYEISQNDNQYFEESDPALLRLSKSVARDLVTSILDNF
jgi:RNase P/RNase MRP subunit p29